MKTSSKEGINDSPKTPSICNTETSIKNETEKNNTAENKITDEQVIEGSHEKKKTTGRFKERLCSNRLLSNNPNN